MKLWPCCDLFQWTAHCCLQKQGKLATRWSSSSTQNLCLISTGLCLLKKKSLCSFLTAIAGPDHSSESTAYPAQQGSSVNLPLPAPPAVRSCKPGQDSWPPLFLHLSASRKDNPSRCCRRGVNCLVGNDETHQHLGNFRNLAPNILVSCFSETFSKRRRKKNCSL